VSTAVATAVTTVCGRDDLGGGEPMLPPQSAKADFVPLLQRIHSPRDPGGRGRPRGPNPHRRLPRG